MTIVNNVSNNNSTTSRPNTSSTQRSMSSQNVSTLSSVQTPVSSTSSEQSGATLDVSLRTSLGIPVRSQSFSDSDASSEYKSTDIEAFGYLQSMDKERILTLIQNIEKMLECAISKDLFQDPGIVDSGHTFERDSISRWCQTNPINPLTRQPMSSTVVRANRVIARIQNLIQTCNREDSVSLQSFMQELNKEIRCPLLGSIMNDPVIGPDENSYERRGMEAMFSELRSINGVTSSYNTFQNIPGYSQAIEIKTNFILKEIVEAYREVIPDEVDNLDEEVLVDSSAVFQRYLELNSVDSQGNSLLHVASRVGDVAAILKLRSVGVSTSLKNLEGDTPLHVAVKGQVLASIYTLAEKGMEENVIHLDAAGKTPVHVLERMENLDDESVMVELNALRNGIFMWDSDGKTPLHRAFENGNVNFSTTFFVFKTHRAPELDLNVRDKDGNTVLHAAVAYNQTKMMALCIHYKMDVNAGNNAGNTPLHLAVKRGDLAIIRVLCGEGAKQDLVNKDGDTPLHVAVKMIISQEIKGDLCLKIVSELLGDGALNIRNKSGKTPLYMAIESGLKDLAAGFLNVGANPNISGPRKNTPLHCAVSSRKNELNTGVTYLSLVERLVKHGADLTAVDGDGNTPLHLAIKYNWVDFVPFLSEGAMGIQNKLGDTPLHVAAIIDLRGGVLRLRDQGVSFSMPDKNGDYPIHVAARKGALKVIPLLHDGKTLISSPNSEEDTPLHVAVKAQRGDVVRVLIKEGADCFAVDGEGRTPLEVAAEHGRLDIISVFKECKTVAKFSLKPYTGEVKKMLSTMRYSSLYEAVKNNDIEAAKRCISKRPQLVNMPSVEGNCPLHLAVKMGNIDMIHLLIHSGADLSVENDNKHTPGTLASVNKRKDIRLFMIHESYAYRGLSVPSKLSA